MRYAIVDAANLFNRAHHVCSGDAFTKAGMALHIIFNALNKIFKEKNIDHFVIAGEGRSWRYEVYPEYKANRILKRKLQTAKEKEEQEVFYSVLADLMDFFENETRMTMLRMQGAEGDDFIARWVQLHPDDDHIIVSGDSDNIQLLAPNVSIFDGVQNRTLTHEGVYDQNGNALVFEVNTSSGKLKVGLPVEEERKKKIKDNKAKLSEETKKLKDYEKRLKAEKKILEKTKDQIQIIKQTKIVDALERDLARANLAIIAANNELAREFTFTPEKDWPQKALFLKIIRGDAGDGIFSANPGVRYKTSKNAVGIEDAWNERHSRGYYWNNFMLNTWDKLLVEESGKHTSKSVKVLDEYHRNEMLIDLTKQPDAIKDGMDQAILEAVQKTVKGSIGINVARFFKKHDMNRLYENASDHARYMGAPYTR